MNNTVNTSDVLEALKTMETLFIGLKDSNPLSERYAAMTEAYRIAQSIVTKLAQFSAPVQDEVA